jgi:hypothetical protein
MGAVTGSGVVVEAKRSVTVTTLGASGSLWFVVSAGADCPQAEAARIRAAITPAILA